MQRLWRVASEGWQQIHERELLYFIPPPLVVLFDRNDLQQERVAFIEKKINDNCR